MMGAQPLVNVLVCGDYMQLQLIPELAKRVQIGRVYYAVRRSRDAAALGLRPQQAVNVFVKEYLVQAHARYLNHYQCNRIYPWYDCLWEQVALARWQRCDLLHAVLHGNSRRLIEKARATGSRVLGHPVNSHPLYFNRIVQEEQARLGLPVEAVRGPERTLAEIELCDHLFCLSKFVKDSYVANGFPADRISVIHLPIYTQNFAPQSEPPSMSPFRVVCVGQVSPRKGQLYLLEAWKQLKLPNAELVIVGIVHPDMNRLLAPYQGLFRHVPHISQAGLAQLFRSSSLCVLPSLEDGFGLVVTEALTCGTPVLVTESVGSADFVQPGGNGYVVKPRDVDAIREAIGRLYRSEDERARLRAGALKSAAALPTLSDACDQLAGLYRKMVA